MQGWLRWLRGRSPGSPKGSRRHRSCRGCMEERLGGEAWIGTGGHKSLWVAVNGEKGPVKSNESKGQRFRKWRREFLDASSEICKISLACNEPRVCKRPHATFQAMATTALGSRTQPSARRIERETSFKRILRIVGSVMNTDRRESNAFGPRTLITAFRICSPVIRSELVSFIVGSAFALKDATKIERTKQSTVRKRFRGSPKSRGCSSRHGHKEISGPYLQESNAEKSTGQSPESGVNKTYNQTGFHSNNLAMFKSLSSHTMRKRSKSDVVDGAQNCKFYSKE